MSPVTGGWGARGAEGKARHCQRADCVTIKRELKATVKEQEQRLHRLESDWRLNGPGNARDAEYRRLQNTIDSLRGEVARGGNDRRWIERELSAASAERLELQATKAALLGEVSLLRGRVAEFERAEQRRREGDAVRERYAARAVARERAAARAKGEQAVRGAEAEVASAAASVAAITANAEEAIMQAQAAAAEQIAKAQASAEADAERRVAAAEARAAAAEASAKRAEEWAEQAVDDADEARSELIEEEAAAREASAKLTAAEWATWDAERRAKRAKSKAEKLQSEIERTVPSTRGRTPDEWAALSADARWKAAERERDHLLSVFKSHPWRLVDVGDAIQMCGWTRGLFDTRPFFDVHFEKVSALTTHLEKEEYGVTFGLYLHYEARLPFPKILKLSQAAAKKYDHHLDRYKPKVLLGHRYLKGVSINVPRPSPPISVLEPQVRALEKVLNIETAEDGQMAFVPFDSIIQQVLSRDPGRGDMPPLPYFLGGNAKLPLVISWDATGLSNSTRSLYATRTTRPPPLSSTSSLSATVMMGAPVQLDCSAATSRGSTRSST